jgi:phenylpropionate dioxygenase-like ring-hydroxylating dioxygenase large terminal subunit
MFVSDTHLPQLLPAAAYRDESFFRREMDRLFLHGWHAVAVRSDLRPDSPRRVVRIGDIAVELAVAGTTPVARRLTDAAGRTGWPVRMACRGQLVFVSLAADGPSLGEFLGELGGVIDACFGDDVEQVFGHDMPCACNWKVAVENGLESYHVESVHRGTFMVMPPAEVCRHEVHPDHTVFRVPSSAPGSLYHRIETWVASATGRSATHEYVHWKGYPSLAFSRTDLVTILHSALPVSPTSCVYHFRLFMPRSGRCWWARPLLAWLRPRQAAFWGLVLEEDGQIFPRIQAGLNAPVAPRGGVVSAREERIFHFQRTVAARCGIDAGDPAPAHQQRSAPGCA